MREISAAPGYRGKGQGHSPGQRQQSYHWEKLLRRQKESFFICQSSLAFKQKQ